MVRLKGVETYKKKLCPFFADTLILIFAGATVKPFFAKATPEKPARPIHVPLQSGRHDRRKCKRRAA